MEGSRERRQQPSPQDGTYREEEGVKPLGTIGEPSAAAAPTKVETGESVKAELMEEVLERRNLAKALKRVEENRGAAGVDGMTVKELRQHLQEHWAELRERLLWGNYEPKPVRRVEIPKPDGGVRKLGIPTVLDRFIQRRCCKRSRRALTASFRSLATGSDLGGGHMMRWMRPGATSREGTDGWWT